VGVSLVTGPTFEPVSLEEARTHCRVTQTDEDGLLAGYIMAARVFAETNTRTIFAQQTFDCTYDYYWPCNRNLDNGYVYEVFNSYLTGYGYSRIELPVYPVSSVNSVKYLDSNGVQQTLDPSQYLVSLDGPVAFIDPAYGVTWPTPRCQVATVTVRVVAGFGTLPSDTPETIRQAMLMMIEHFYDNRSAVSGDVAEMPLGVEALLSTQRRSRILS